MTSHQGMQLVHLYPLDFVIDDNERLNDLTSLQLALVQFHPSTTSAKTRAARKIWHTRRRASNYDPATASTASTAIAWTDHHLYADLNFIFDLAHLEDLTSIQLLALQFRADFPGETSTRGEGHTTYAERVEDVWLKRASTDQSRGLRWVPPPVRGEVRAAAGTEVGPASRMADVDMELDTSLDNISSSELGPRDSASQKDANVQEVEMTKSSRNQPQRGANRFPDTPPRQPGPPGPPRQQLPQAPQRDSQPRDGGRAGVSSSAPAHPSIPRRDTSFYTSIPAAFSSTLYCIRLSNLRHLSWHRRLLTYCPYWAQPDAMMFEGDAGALGYLERDSAEEALRCTNEIEFYDSTGCRFFPRAERELDLVDFKYISLTKRLRYKLVQEVERGMWPDQSAAAYARATTSEDRDARRAGPARGRASTSASLTDHPGWVDTAKDVRASDKWAAYNEDRDGHRRGSTRVKDDYDRGSARYDERDRYRSGSHRDRDRDRQFYRSRSRSPRRRDERERDRDYDRRDRDRDHDSGRDHYSSRRSSRLTPPPARRGSYDYAARERERRKDRRDSGYGHGGDRYDRDGDRDRYKDRSQRSRSPRRHPQEVKAVPHREVQTTEPAACYTTARTPGYAARVDKYSPVSPHYSPGNGIRYSPATTRYSPTFPQISSTSLKYSRASPQSPCLTPIDDYGTSGGRASYDLTLL